MSISGPDALRALDEAIRDIRREEDEIAKRAARNAELRTKLSAQQAALYRQLGALRLEPEPREAQAAIIADATRKVGAAIARYDAAFAAAEAQLLQVEADIARCHADRIGLQSDAAKRDGELSSLAAKARPSLGSNADYAARLRAARELSETAEAALAKAAESEAERERNGRPYRDDPLFMYLRERGYGTERYRRNSLTAWLDGKLAAFCGYERARTNFALINDLPARLRQHAEHLQERARAAAAGVAALESVAVDTAGGRGAREAIEDLVSRIEELDGRNVVLQDQRDQAIEARGALADGDDPDLQAAAANLAALLKRDDFRALLRQARATPTERGIGIVQQLDDLAQRVKDGSDEAREHRARLATLGARRRDLEDVQFELKRRGLDNPNSRFADDSLTDDQLNDFLRGEISATSYWEHWRRSQSWSAAGYGGPGGGWGRRQAADAGNELSRPRGQPAGDMTSAA
jgi:hypothetical protein